MLADEVEKLKEENKMFENSIKILGEMHREQLEEQKELVELGEALELATKEHYELIKLHNCYDGTYCDCEDSITDLKSWYRKQKEGK